MSVSAPPASNVDPEVLIVHGASDRPDPLAALRGALSEIGSALTAAGAAPSDLVSMTWTARRPALIHPAQPVVDLAFREHYGGVRPAIAVAAADHDGVRVSARARRPEPPSGGRVWGPFTAAELAREYNTRRTVPNIPAIFASWRNNGAAFRSQHLTAELSYGPTAGESVDIYLPRNGPALLPLWIFVHGGFWQALDKEHNAHFAAGMLQAGYAVAMPNHTLAPGLSLSGIVGQLQACVAFLAREARALGCNPHGLHIAGHSAGGHLAAMIAALPEGRLIRSCLPLSGLFDLAPLAQLPMGPMLGLDGPDVVARLSPFALRPQPHVRLGLAVGGAESGEFRRQSTDLAKAWGTSGGAVPCKIIPDHNHFTLLDGLHGGALLDFAREIASDPR